MIFYSLCEVIETEFRREWGAFEAALDDNHGCLEMTLEDRLQMKFKKIQKIDNFKDYYKWM